MSAAGDHFLVGLRPTPELHPLDRALLRDLQPAGVILYKSNFRHGSPYAEWLEALRRLLADVRKECGRERLFIGIDHEGGRVTRTPPPITRFSYAAEWADRSAEVGRAMGRELASLGINLSFAPVLDIHSNPANPVIGARAFGTTGAAVIAAALPFAASLEKSGVLACGKHFPGHGDTDKDSHFALPVLQQDLVALRARELQPFAAAIAAGIPMLMTSHISVPKIDSEPVTLSRRFITGILREQMGYPGVVVSDDIGMQAISGLFDDPRAAVQLLVAGCDMVMVCAHWTDTERSRGFAEAMLEAARKGDLPAHVTGDSRRRVRELLARTPQHSVAALSETVLAENRAAGPLFEKETVEVI
ncbi:MAG TPA: beta-N-acetylhexosaminidase [Steroidobacteraceae bacterium]|nr:beta-N-acetylhexosaminidase [Steroidobacteraceae bacterium]